LGAAAGSAARLLRAAFAATQLAHFFPRLLALVVAELAVAVFVELFYDLFAHLGARTAITLLAFRVGGEGRNCQQARRHEDKADKQIPHVVFPLSE
jgi:hypothetical protein